MKELDAVIGRVRGWRRGWTERTKLQRIDLYTRLTLCALPWVFLVTWGLLPLGKAFGQGPVPVSLAVAFLVVNAAQCLLSNRNVDPAFAHYRGVAPFPLLRLRLLRCCWRC